MTATPRVQVWHAFFTCSILAVLGINPTNAIGDLLPPPGIDRAISADGTAVCKIWPSQNTPSTTSPEEGIVRVYGYDPKSDSFLRQSTFSMEGESLPQQILISNDGNTIVFAYTHNSIELRNGIKDWVALRVYTPNGGMPKKWYISELLDSKQQEACTPMMFSLRWIREMSIDDNGVELRLAGPNPLDEWIPYSWTLQVDVASRRVTKSIVDERNQPDKKGE